MPHRTPLLITVASAATLLLSQVTTAQNRRMMIMDSDDSNGSAEMMSISLPDLKTLLAPDWQMDDMPTFDRTLHLSEPQHEVVRARLRAYLDAFAALSEARRAQLRGGPIMMFDEPMFMGESNARLGGGDGEGDDGETLGDILREAFGGGADGGEGGPTAVMIGVTADAGAGPGGFGPGGGGEGPEGEAEVMVWAPAGDGEGGEGAGAGVTIQVAGSGDVEIPPEVIEKIRAKAEEMARRMEERLAEAEPGDEITLDPLGGNVSIADHHRQLEALAEAAEKFQDEKDELGESFLRDVQFQLSPEQMELWPSFERAMTRKKTLPEGRLDGERTDLFRLVDREALDEVQQEKIAEALGAYELALDAALTRRNDYLEASQDRLDEAVSGGDLDKAIDIAEKAARLRVAVRDTNARYADAIAATLGGEAGPAFRDAALQRAHPRVYRDTLGRRAFRKAERLPDLDPDVAAAIVELHAAYEEDLADVNESIRQAILRHQPKESSRHLEELKLRMEDGEPMMLGIAQGDDPVHAAFGRRRELDRRYLTQLTSLLGPEYQDQMPRAPSRDPGEPIIIEVGGGGPQ